VSRVQSAHRVLESFRPFSALHGIVVVAFATGCALAVAHGRAKLGTETLRRHERWFAWANLAVWVLVQFWTLLPRNFVAASALPLHVCDLASPLATAAILRPGWRVARTVLYYWGIGLCTQAFITPDLKEGPNDLRFWAFWLPHAGLVGAAVYDIGARGYRPGWNDLRVASLITFAYAVVVFTIDAIFDWNYVYLGRSPPDQPSAVDFLGPWPARVGVMFAIGQVLFIGMTLPFRPWKALAGNNSGEDVSPSRVRP
jgi:hypothetical integral membrane protein (TIGR02206 family)